MPIPVFFSRYGEAAFRDLEAQVLQDLGKGSGQVIATVGGCVTREENYLSLRQNGKIIWIQRPLNLLSIQGRPLSQEMGLEELFKARRSLYARFAGCTVSNAGTFEEVIQQILEVTAP